MPRDIAGQPVDSLDLQVFRAILEAAPGIMERVEAQLAEERLAEQGAPLGGQPVAVDSNDDGDPAAPRA